MPADPLLDHLEKTFADAYRKEIDQEENVWRSLPFFAATLALQVAALAQVREWITAVAGPVLVIAIILLVSAGVATLAAIVFLAFSVWPADFQYVGREPAFREYAEKVRAQAEEVAPQGTEQEISDYALRTVKAALAEQYATAADNNRLINQSRAKWRTRAGLSTLASVFAVLVLVALVVITNIHGHGRKALSGFILENLGSSTLGNVGPAPTKQRAPAANGGGSQGMVGRPGDGASGSRIGGGRP